MEDANRLKCVGQRRNFLDLETGRGIAGSDWNQSAGEAESGRLGKAPRCAGHPTNLPGQSDLANDYESVPQRAAGPLTGNRQCQSEIVGGLG